MRRKPAVSRAAGAGAIYIPNSTLSVVAKNYIRRGLSDTKLTSHKATLMGPSKLASASGLVEWAGGMMDDGDSRQKDKGR